MESISEIRNNELVENLATTKLSVYTQDATGSIPIELDFKLQPAESFQIAGIDDTRLISYVNSLSEQDKADLLSGTACIVKNPIPFSYEGENFENTSFEYNDTILVNEYKLRVVGIANTAVTINNEGFTNGVQIIVSNKTYDLLTANNYYLEVYPTLKSQVGIANTAVTINNEGFTNGVQIIVSNKTYDLLTANNYYLEVYPTLKSQMDHAQFETWLDNWCDKNTGSHWISYQQTAKQLEESFNLEVYPTLKSQMDHAQFETWLDNWCDKNTGSHWISYQQTAKQLEESFKQISMLCWWLIFFIGFIGILNIVNTVYSNIHTRIAEIGMQRAIGMSQ